MKFYLILGALYLLSTVSCAEETGKHVKRGAISNLEYNLGTGFGNSELNYADLSLNGAGLRTGLGNSLYLENGLYSGYGFGNGINIGHGPGFRTSLSNSHQTVAVPVPRPVPVTVNRRVPVPIEHPVAVPVPRPVKVPIPQPVPVPITRAYPVPVNRPYPVPVPKAVPVSVPHPVRVDVPQPYPVTVPHPVPVLQPYPVHSQYPLHVGAGLNVGLNNIGLGSTVNLNGDGLYSYNSGHSLENELGILTPPALIDNHSFLGKFSNVPATIPQQYDTFGGYKY